MEMENKHITPEDLMIGDWVLMDVNYDSNYEFDNVKYEPFQIQSGEDIDLAIENNMNSTDGVYKGIQITHELLEKNGRGLNLAQEVKDGIRTISIDTFN